MESLKMEKEGGVPVFYPTYEQFRDFKKFVNAIEPIGMTSGIVKIVPPAEWLEMLPEVDGNMMSSIRIKNPIQQEASGSHGVYCMKNIQKSRSYDITSWYRTCHDPSYQPPADRGQKRDRNPKVPDNVAKYDDSAFDSERCRALEKQYWRTLGFNTPMYGADMPGSLFDDTVKDWNVANLDSILQNLTMKIPGVNTAYLYCGMWKATFAWHLEDMDLHSINYIHFGAPKQWYSIPQNQKDKFYKYMRTQFPIDSRRCKEFLRHKTFLVSPAHLRSQGIEVNSVVHRQREFMITFPYGYHAGFNYGYNVAESVNFATESWLDIGMHSNNCRCISDAVGIDVARLIRTINGEPEPESEPELSDDELNDQLPTPPPGDETHRPKRRKTAAGKRKTRLQADHKYSTVTAKPRRRGYCALCPHKWDGEYLVNDLRNAKIHRICAEIIPETRVESDLVYGLESVSKDRFALKCGDCRSVLGACFQCSHPHCTRAFHATCAASAGVVSIDGQYLCRSHRPRPTVSISRSQDTLAQAATLLVGDTIQCQSDSRRMFAGVVTENNLSEGMLLVNCHPNFDDVLEVPHSNFLPGRFEPIGDLWSSVKSKDDVAAAIASEQAEAAKRLELPNMLVPRMHPLSPAAEPCNNGAAQFLNSLPPIQFAPQGSSHVLPRMPPIGIPGRAEDFGPGLPPPGTDPSSQFIFMGIPLPPCLSNWPQ